MRIRVLLFLTAIAAVVESYIVTDTKIGSRLGQDDDRLRMTPLGSLEDRIRIEAPEPSRRMVRSGDNVTLTCEASHPWFLCLWVHPGDGKLCSIKEDGSAHAQTVCQGVEGAELVTNKGANSCSVLLTRVGEQEAGEWMCLLSQSGVFHTDRIITQLSVASPASLELRADKKMVRIQEEDDMEEDILELAEDETLSLECGARGGHPEPRLHWALTGAETGDQRTVGGLEEIRVSSLETEEGHLTSDITYTARLGDSGRRLVCVSEQVNPWTGEMMHNTTASVRLMVRARASPLQALLTEQQDVVAGVIISCCLIIFCIVIIIIFTVRSSKAVNSPKRSLAKSKHRESYIIFLEEEPSIVNEACETMETKEISKESGAESGIDVSHGDFVSFSSSDMYSSKAASEERAVSDHDQSSSDHQMTSDDSHHPHDTDVTLSPHDTSSDGCAASEGGLSNLSVFDCQHGCFHDDSHHHHYHHSYHHQPEHHYIKGDVLNTDL